MGGGAPGTSLDRASHACLRLGRAHSNHIEGLVARLHLVVGERLELVGGLGHVRCRRSRSRSRRSTTLERRCEIQVARVLASAASRLAALALDLAVARRRRPLEVPVALDLRLRCVRGHVLAQAEVEVDVYRITGQVAALDVVRQHALVVARAFRLCIFVAFNAGHSSGLEGRQALPLAVVVLVLLPQLELLAVHLQVAILVAPVAAALAFALALAASDEPTTLSAFASAFSYPVQRGLALRDVLVPLLVGVVPLHGVDLHRRGSSRLGLLVLEVVRKHHELLGELGDVLRGTQLPSGLHLGEIRLRDHLEDDRYAPFPRQRLSRLALVEL